MLKPTSIKARFIRENPYALLCLIFIAIFSIAAGTSTYFTVYSGSHGFFIGGIGDMTFKFIYFLKSLLLNVSFFILICLPGIWIPGLLFSFLSLILKGFLNGFVTGAILSEMGAAGIPVLLISVILPETVLLTIYMAACIKSFNEWRIRVKDFAFGRKCIPVSRIYLKEVLLLLFFLILAVLLENVVSSVAFRFIS